MDENRPMFVADEKKDKLPILIVDKTGKMGMEFAEKLSEQFLIILVSTHTLDVTQNTIHVPYRKKVPSIPDNNYSHIFVFYNGESEVLDLLPALAQKANATNGKLTFITPLLFSSSRLFTYLSAHQFLHAQVIVYGEIFESQWTDHNMVNIFFHQKRLYGRIEVPYDPGKLYPVALPDVFDAIIHEAFGDKKNKQPLLVFPRHPLSEISIARMLHKKNPTLKIDFKKYKGKPPVYYIPKQGEYFFNDYPLEERLYRAEKTYKPKLVAQGEKRKHYQRRPVILKKRHLFLGMLVAFFLPIITVLFVGVLGVGAFYLSFTKIEKGELETALTLANFSQASLTISKPYVPRLNTFYKLVSIETDTLYGATLLKQIAEKKSSDPKNNFMEAIAIFKNSLISIQKMKAEGELPQQVEIRLARLEKILTPLENTVDSFPFLLGFEGKRQYLVLFQNNMELRPGGGFIGSYGMLSLDRGRVISFKVYDVYDADGKLTTHIEPPFALRRYLGSSNWFLRDSNFSIDYVENAKQAKTFLKLETGESVDGVIAVDTGFLQNILAAIGSVDVMDYKQVVNKDNFYLLTQSHAEKDFFPGSTQKKDFMRALLVAIQAKIRDDKTLSYTLLANSLGKSIENKHLFFAFADEASQKLFTVNNLSSSLWDGREKSRNEYLDFFAVVDANLGLNKVNYYLKREIQQKAVITQTGDIQTTATITYTNTSKRDSQFGGDYKNYLRFVLPQHVVVNDVLEDGVKRQTIAAITDAKIFTDKNFLVPKELEIERGEVGGKDTYGMLIVVPAGKSKKIAITYTAPQVYSMNDTEATYDVSLFKQPGTGDDPYSFFLVYPASLRVVNTSAALSNVGGKLQYLGALTTNVNLHVEFAKK